MKKKIEIRKTSYASMETEGLPTVKDLEDFIVEGGIPPHASLGMYGRDGGDTWKIRAAWEL